MESAWRVGKEKQRINAPKQAKLTSSKMATTALSGGTKTRH